MSREGLGPVFGASGECHFRISYCQGSDLLLVRCTAGQVRTRVGRRHHFGTGRCTHRSNHDCTRIPADYCIPFEMRQLSIPLGESRVSLNTYGNSMLKEGLTISSDIKFKGCSGVRIEEESKEEKQKGEVSNDLMLESIHIVVPAELPTVKMLCEHSDNTE